MRKSKFISCFLVATTCFAFIGCSSTPKSNATLDTAHSSFKMAQADPDVQKYAPLELKDADDALKKADQALKEHERMPVVEHLSYMAEQKVVIAQTQAQLKANEERIKNFSVEREKFLLQQRTMEADRLRNELNAKQTSRGLSISLGDVLFDTAKSKLKPGGARTVDKLAQFLQQNPDRSVSIEGFTDSRGSEEYNQSLSERRADAVKAELISQGVPENRIVSRGYGKAYPVADNGSSAGRQMNRRVEVIISDAGKQISPR